MFEKQQTRTGLCPTSCGSDKIITKSNPQWGKALFQELKQEFEEETMDKGCFLAQSG